jgi:ABC-type transport system involved in multi-copper enzyme maturation permease subunit
MTSFPIVLRELRLESRRRSMYWLRVLGAVVMAAIFLGCLAHHQGNVNDLGAKVFAPLHTVLFFTVWLVAPLLIADCLAKEKREETLGLLLLTRLTPSGIVAAKGCVHAFRASLLVLAALPILCLPFILGGVSATETWVAVLLDLNALLLALAVGLVVSASTRRWAAALVVAEIASLAFCLAFCAAYTAAFEKLVAPVLSGLPRPGPLSLGEFWLGVWQLIADFQGGWGKTLAATPPGAEQVWLSLLWLLANVSLLVVALAWQLAARQLRCSVLERPASIRRLHWQQLFLAPRVGRSLERRLRQRLLVQNPIAWLQVYSWRARAAKWGWCLFIAGAEWLLVLLRNRDYWLTGQILLGLAYLLSVVFAAAASWRQERRTGLWELILISPLTPWQLVGGRARGLYSQFLAGLLAWLGCLWFCSPPGTFDESGFALGLFGLGAFLVVPLVGQDSAVNIRGFWPAWLTTSAAVVLTPGIVFLISLQEGWVLLILVGLMHLGLAAVCGFGLQRQFSERRFWTPPRPRRRRFVTSFSTRRHRARRMAAALDGSLPDHTHLRGAGL